MNENISEKSIRIASIAMRIAINGIILMYAIFKASSGFTPKADAEMNHSIKMILISATGVDTLFCLGGIYFKNAFRIHYIMNIIITVMSFLIVAAISGVLKSLVIIPLLGAPFVYYTLQNARVYRDSVKDLREIMKKQKNQNSSGQDKE